MSFLFSPSAKSFLLVLTLLAALLPGCGASPASDDDYEDEESESDGGRTTSRTDGGSRPVSSVRDGGSTPPVSRSDAAAPANPLAPGDRTPSKDNIKECPPVAPENPVGSCIGVPIYATCSYTTYNCICDWYHWICI